MKRGEYICKYCKKRFCIKKIIAEIFEIGKDLSADCFRPNEEFGKEYRESQATTK